MDSDDEFQDAYNDDDDTFFGDPNPGAAHQPPVGGAGRDRGGAMGDSAGSFGGLFNALAGGSGPFGNPAAGGMFGSHAYMRPPARAFAKNYRAYSTAILEIKQGRADRSGGRSNVMHGGKIIMPPDALNDLMDMEMESPFMFEVRNLAPDKRELFTHCGVLEFIAEPGTVHLPAWMMKRLELNEGDPIRLTGAKLPKGKLAKFQPQSSLFLELSDHKSVLEAALTHFSCLTKGDIIEIYHNMMTFEILIMEVEPSDVPGVSIFETDLSVDFAAPLDYVEPTPQPRAPPPTLASKLKIDTTSTQSVDARGSGASTPVNGGWEAFKGGGKTMGGKSVKGKGVGKKGIEEVDENSKIVRTGVQKIITPDTQIGERKVPAKLELPYGTLFFGYSVPIYDPSAPSQPSAATAPPQVPFAAVEGSGNTLSGRARPTPSASTSASPAPGPAAGVGEPAKVNPFGGQGNSLVPPKGKPKGKIIEID